MSATAIQKLVNQALSNDGDKMNPTIDAGEACAIVSNATADGKVTNAEAKTVADAYEATRGPSPGAPNPSGCLYTGPIMDPEARETFDGFFAKYGIPAGNNVKPIKQQISETWQYEARGERTTKAPNTRNLLLVPLRDSRPVDGPLTEAFVDAAKGQFYVKSTPARGFDREGNAIPPSWFGPLKIAASERSKESAATAIKTAFAAQFPPKYTSSFELNESSFELQRGFQGAFTFKFSAKEYNGGFAGPILKGEKTFTGTYNSNSGEVRFAGEPEPAPAPVAAA